MQEGNNTTSGSSSSSITPPVNGEIHEVKYTTTPSGGRKPFNIPRLDEKQLEMKLHEGNNNNINSNNNNAGQTSSFVVSEGGTERSSAPLNSNAPAFVFGAGGAYNNNNNTNNNNNNLPQLSAGSPSVSAAYLSYLQQQSLQYQMSHVTVADQELLLTHNILQQCPRDVLLMVLVSLVDENPTICPLIRARCEKAAIILTTQQQQQQQLNVSNRYASHISTAASWAPHTTAGANFESPRAAAGNIINNNNHNSASPHSTTNSGRKGRGNKAREEGICSLHNSVRSMNHLQLNKQTGLYECIHGFHCLEDGGSTAVTPSNLSSALAASTPIHNNNNNNNNNNNISNSTGKHNAGGPPPLSKVLSGQVRPSRDISNSGSNHKNNNNNNNNSSSSSGTSHSNNYYGANNNNNNNMNMNGGNLSHNITPPQEGSEAPTTTTTTTTEENIGVSAPNIELLNSLLKSIREIEKEEGQQSS